MTSLLLLIFQKPETCNKKNPYVTTKINLINKNISTCVPFPGTGNTVAQCPLAGVDPHLKTCPTTNQLFMMRMISVWLWEIIKNSHCYFHNSFHYFSFKGGDSTSNKLHHTLLKCLA